LRFQRGTIELSAVRQAMKDIPHERLSQCPYLLLHERFFVAAQGIQPFYRLPVLHLVMYTPRMQVSSPTGRGIDVYACAAFAFNFG